MRTIEPALPQVLALAAAHPPFAAALARDPVAAAAAAGITLTPAEQRTLAAGAGRPLVARLGERLPEADRRQFLALATAACATLAASGCGKPGSRPRPAADAAPAVDAALAPVPAPPAPQGCARPPVTVGGDARYFATGTGIRPDRPPPKPDPPRVALTLTAVEGTGDFVQRTLPGHARGWLPRIALALSDPNLLPDVCPGELRLAGRIADGGRAELVSVTGPYSEQVALAIGVHLSTAIKALPPGPVPPGPATFTLVLKVQRLP